MARESARPALGGEATAGERFEMGSKERPPESVRVAGKHIKIYLLRSITAYETTQIEESQR
ncbi:hypothetical protein A4R35_04530 [Thermogemmatispora tikiterensis]|uniref:Uncharacterized protein n=1 Tax=Thermogemmatispora tikiterensis TaxID=1825093 RepID=A0A328VDA0_9CHLR|nr:hypothetical protein A4R35_04530 [Thermogemmatispora tikiterensis]